MTRSYGKTTRPRRQPPTPPSAEIQINITGRHTLEQLSLEVQRAIARLQDHGIAGVEKSASACCRSMRRPRQWPSGMTTGSRF